MSSTSTVPRESIVREFLSNKRISRAFHFFESHAGDFIKEQVQLCSIPAPPFGETERAQYLCNKFRKRGLKDAAIDGEGNCLALRAGNVSHAQCRWYVRKLAPTR